MSQTTGTRFGKGLRPGLYAVTDSSLLPGQALLAGVEAALRGGAVLVQYREKTAPPQQRLREAKALVALCRPAGVPLLINDDPELALEVGADGVHLGQQDCPVWKARALLGDNAIIGATCHADLNLARAAREAGADYLAFGRFFPSTTKPGAPPADPSVLAAARDYQRPVTAIGGITIGNGAPLIRAGADLLAVAGGLFAESPEETEERARTFTRLFEKHHPLFQPH